MKAQICPCGKQRSYNDCCGRFIEGQQIPKTPEQLMRSRYTAYALGGHGDYLLNTWFPITAQGLDALQLSARTRVWQKLEIMSKTQEGDEGTVEFKAYYFPLDGSSENLEVMHELSEFRRIAGKWLYVGGRVE